MESKKIKKIIIVVSDLFLPNGLATSTRNLYDALRDAGYEVEYFLQYESSKYFSENYKIFRMNPLIRWTPDMKHFSTSKGYLKPARILLGCLLDPLIKLRIKNHLKFNNQNDTLIIGASMEAFNYFYSKNSNKFRRIIQFHMSHEGLTEYDWKNINQAFKTSQSATVLSEEDLVQLAKKIDRNFYVVPNIIDMHQSQNNYSVENKKLVFAGRLSETKQVHHIVQSFIEIDNDEWQLHIYGDGSERQKISDLIKGDQRIFFHGSIENIATAFHDAGINVLSSKIEGLPMTIIEAGQMGVPTVAYAVSPGVEHGVGQGGILVEKQNQQELTKALQYLMNDSNIRKIMSQNAFEQASHYLPKEVVSVWETIFDSLQSVR